MADNRTHDARAADFNRDGLLDVVTRGQSDFGAKAGNRIHVWIQNQDRSWQSTVLNCPHGEGIAIADLDRDGDPDVVIGGIWFETLRDGDNVRWIEHRFAEWHASASVAVGDINRDGRPDIILAPSELAKQQYKMSWWEAPSDPRSGTWREHIIAEPVECVVHGVQVADIDLDGNLDIVYAEMHQGQDPDEVGIFMNRGKGLKWDKQVIATTGSHDIQVADLDRDGDMDVFGANWSGKFQHAQIWLNETKRTRGRR